MQNKGLPTGAGQWAREIDEGLAKLKEIEAIARRMCADFGLDFSDPSRGLNTGNAPSIQNPVQLKLPSLQDLDIRDAQDGDLLTFDGATGKWVARRHDTVQLPKTFPEGDPDSYYVPPVEGEFIPADTWSDPLVFTNTRTDPSFENGTGGWEEGGEESNANTHAEFTSVSGGRRGQAMQIAFSNVSEVFPDMPTGARLRNLPLDTRRFAVWIKGGNVTRQVSVYLAYIYATGPRVTNPILTETVSPGEWTLFFVTGSPGITEPPIAVSAWIGMNVTTGTPQTLIVDDHLTSSDAIASALTTDSFNGATPDTNDYVFDWTDTPDASTSTATRKRRIQVPSTASIGAVIQVIGEGYVPGESVDLYLSGTLLDTITAEPDGTFDARLTIPADADVIPNNSISALVASPGTSISATIAITAG